MHTDWIQAFKVNYDIPADQLPPQEWSGAQNMRVGDGELYVTPGYQEVFGTATPLSMAPFYLIQNSYQSNHYWLSFGTNEVNVWNGSTQSDITPTVAPSATLNQGWTGGTLNNHVFANNGVDNPYGWNNNVGTVMAPLTDWPASTTCTAMRAFKEFLFALGVQDASSDINDKIMWSDAAPEDSLPTSWTAGGSSLAGSATLSDTPGDIIDAAVLGSEFYIYKQRSVYRCSYTGESGFVFNFELAFSDFGMLTDNCAVEYNGQHFVVADGDVIMHDGVKYHSIANDYIRSYIFDQLDQDAYTTSFVMINKEKDEIWFCFPVTGDTAPTRAAIYHVSKGEWQIYAFSSQIGHGAAGIKNDSGALSLDWTDTAAWEDDATKWNQVYFNPALNGLFIADYDNSKIHQLDEGTDHNGEAFEGYVEKLTDDLQDAHHFKVVHKLYLDIIGTEDDTVTVTVGLQDSLRDTVQWLPAQTFTIGTDDHIEVDYEAKYFSFKVSGASFAIRGYYWEHQPGGED